MVSTFQNYTRYLVIVLFALFLAACETVPKESATSTASSSSSSSSAAVELLDGVYVGSDTIEMLSVDVPDRIFFAYDSYSLTKAAQNTLEKQAKWLKANGSATIAIEGHADERGTREYNLALGDRRANSAKDYLMTQGISSSRITTISFGKERPVSIGSNKKAWAQNRRSVTVRTN
jgi:peptidoglycan-associated lipoprotein